MNTAAAAALTLSEGFLNNDNSWAKIKIRFKLTSLICDTGV